MDELLKNLFGDDEQIDLKTLNERIEQKGLKLADISKGDYVAKKKFDDEVASLTAKNTTLEAEKKKLVEAQNTNKTEEEKKLEQLLKDFETLKTTGEQTAKELDLYKKKELMRSNGIENERFMELALFELKDSKDFDADIKTWVENNKDLLQPPTTPPTNQKGKTIPPLGGNPNNPDNPENDAFFKGLLKGSGLDAKDLK